jgi:hypothetical protein
MEADPVVANKDGRVNKHPANFRDLTGQVFGRWTVLSRAPSRIERGNNPVTMWKCRCSCGVETEVRAHDLTRGRTVSCGCFKDEVTRARLTTHGHSVGKGTRTYRCWQNMINRCTNPKNKVFSYYGGRGIMVCERWRNSFQAFLEDMGECLPGLEIDRVENDLGYSKENCRWVTHSANALNRIVTIFVEIKGERMLVSDWSSRSGVAAGLIRERLKNGWEPQRAVFESVKRRVDSFALSDVTVEL